MRIDEARRDLVEVSHLLAVCRARGLDTRVLENERVKILERIDQCISNELSSKKTG